MEEIQVKKKFEMLLFLCSFAFKCTYDKSALFD
jgi:hypothetical protein